MIHTNQIRGWKGGLTEFTDNLETVERYRRVDDTIEGEITFYDAEVFVQPVRARLAYELDTNPRPELRPLYNTCTDTNGPSTKVYMDERGLLNERLPGDPLYWGCHRSAPVGDLHGRQRRKIPAVSRDAGGARQLDRATSRPVNRALRCPQARQRTARRLPGQCSSQSRPLTGAVH